MPVKTSVKKTTKTAKKLIKKAPKKVTWDDIEAGFDRLQKLHEETEKTLKKSQDEAWAAIRETQRAVKETQKNIGGLNNSLGSMVEHLLTPHLPQKFKKMGYYFNRISTYKFAEGVYAQIDGMLENGTQAIAVEVKFTLRISDIDDHLLRMEKIRRFADEHEDKRKFMGALAAINIDKSAKEYALKNGLFVIEQSGEDVKVTKPDQEPRVW